MQQAASVDLLLIRSHKLKVPWTRVLKSAAGQLRALARLFWYRYLTDSKIPQNLRSGTQVDSRFANEDQDVRIPHSGMFQKICGDRMHAARLPQYAA